MRAENLKTKFIDDILRFVGERIERPRQKAVEDFIRAFYANVAADDIAGEAPEDLFSAALSLFNFAQKRSAATPKVRVFNPEVEEHGWKSPHTIIDVVNDDMPFLVDSVTAELNRQDMAVHLVIHPIMRIERDGSGKLLSIGKADAHAESVMQLRVAQAASGARMEQVKARIEAVLADVRAAVTDWQAMLAELMHAIDDVAAMPAGVDKAESEEALAFLKWVADNHFTFLGYREYALAGGGKDASYTITDGPSLGVLKDFSTRVFEGIRNRKDAPPEIRSFINQPKPLLVTKASLRSTVHRDAPMDAIGIKRFDKKGKVIGERLFVGLFTSVAYSRSPWDIPLLRHKVAQVAKRAGFTKNSHDEKALEHILETFPRDELFQATEDELYDIAIGILNLQERQRVALFVRRDPYERFISCFVYLPRDRMTTDIRLTIQEILARALNGKVSTYYTHMDDGPLARLNVIVATTPGEIPAVNLKEIETQIADACRSWRDRLKEALVEIKGEAVGLGLLKRYQEAFPLGFQEQFGARAAVADIERVELALKATTPPINLYRPVEAAGNALHLKLYRASEKIALSNVLPSLENFGLRVISENAYAIEPAGIDEPVWIHDFAMVTADGAEIDVAELRDRFQDAYARIWTAELEDDGFNRLVLTAGLAWRDVALIRAYCKYLRQAAIAFSQAYMEATLCGNPKITQAIARLFHLRNDPAFTGDRVAGTAKINAEIEQMLEGVSNLDDDRILRRYVNAVVNTLRTNFFQPPANGGVKEYISFKLDSQKLDELPLPRPLVEVFVYAPHAEAVHLRGGKVARGGIRWSDRKEDFRTEVLGLMKAQMVKNAVIVPVGSKGGFVVKRPPVGADRETMQAEVIRCYQTLMKGLLDLTDNLVGGKVVPPPSVVRHDGDDPYLVVAADKGTATFSDIANAVSRAYGFWLDDAFASGGSAGYDHKKMGITARGAWENVKRHFRELGTDIQTQAFTCVGVGDMSGDVFGNGMLCSGETRLIAAFNHMHIFIDPNPDPKASFAERKRMFDLPRSTWADYDAKLISAGGGIYERRAKSIKLSPEAQKAIGLMKDQVTPNEVIKAILVAEVDLLFLGGIGTYVKATDETHLEVGDRANDAIRINGNQVRAKVIGEGANLGFTQRGRIEAALSGRRLNTDALDNSAGVDTSDHEVNIKILLNEAVANGDLTMKQRDKLLASMTDDVAKLVLRHNYLQSQALSVAENLSFTLLDQQNRFMRALERAGKLDRAIEFLPDDETMRERLAQRIGLTRPELAVLLAYSKTTLYDELLPSDLPDDPRLVQDLYDYFPPALKSEFRPQIEKHRLRREIIATLVTNSLVNRVGSTFVHVIREKTGQPASAVARAYAIVRETFRFRELWSAIEALDNKVDARTQTEMLIEINRLAEPATSWFLRNGAHPLDVSALLAEAQPGITALEAAMYEIISEPDRTDMDQYRAALMEKGVPKDLAIRIANLPQLWSSLDIVRIATKAGIKVEAAAAVYYDIGLVFGLDWLRDGARRLIGDNHWDRLAVFAIIDDLYGHQRDLTAAVLADQKGKPAKEAIAAWHAARGVPVQRVEQLFADLRQVGKVELSMLAVANRALRSVME
ncbi:NAD-glutamate dehydrogenase [Dongia sp. agr-C8]